MQTLEQVSNWLNGNLSLPAGRGDVLEVVLGKAANGSTFPGILAVKCQTWEVEYYSPGHIASGSYGRWANIDVQQWEEIKLEGQVFQLGEEIQHPEVLTTFPQVPKSQWMEILEQLRPFPLVTNIGRWTYRLSWKNNHISIQGNDGYFAGGCWVDAPVVFLPQELREELKLPCDRFGRLSSLGGDRIIEIWQRFVTL
ncbi:MAG: hypothetical protein ACRCZS_04645 [Chroococcidiopsis sp.]